MAGKRMGWEEVKTHTDTSKELECDGSRAGALQSRGLGFGWRRLPWQVFEPLPCSWR